LNILLVDDDIYVIEAMQKSIDWEYLQIENVYIAHSVQSAKKILNDIPIQVLVCDIEMPKENGFELLNWIREKKYIIKDILLTSYAEFEYANKAVNLNCFAYVLKPVDFDELQRIIYKAMEAQKTALQAVNYKKYFEFWSKSERIRKEDFWEELLLKNTLNTEEDLGTVIAENGLKYGTGQSFTPMIIEYAAQKKDYRGYKRGMFEWNIKNTVSLTLRTIHIGIEGILQTQNERIIVIIQEQELGYRDELLSVAESFIQKAERRLDIRSCVIIGNICSLKRIAGHVQELLNKADRYVISDQKILLPEDYRQEPMDYIPPDFKLWKSLVNDGNEAVIASEIEGYLERFQRVTVVDKEILGRFVWDYVQMLIDVLKQKHIILYHMDNPFFKVEQINESLRSLGSTKQYMLEMLHAVVRRFAQDESSDSVVLRVRKYIDHNLDKEITRESLAKMVFLNQDYLARIFKKEVGESICNYLIYKRMEAAKEYLKKTDEPVNMIALKVGYDNFSYFTRLFKNSVGLTPKEYRNQMAKC